MRNPFTRNRRARYGWMSALLTVLLITVVVLSNALVTKLVERYSLYANMNAKAEYGVTDSCYRVLDAVLADRQDTVNIIFCDTENNLKTDATRLYVYETAKALAERYPDRIRLQYHDTWLNPESVRRFSTTFNPATGEDMEVTLQTNSIIIENGDYYRVYDLTEFFVFAEGDTSQLWAYNGEKKLAAGILHSVEPNAPIVCLTNNHGEVFYDYELFLLLDDAGYQIRHIDLYTEQIPAECDLLISYNPNTDLIVQDGVSARSEKAILEEYLSQSGKSYLVFLENGTPSLPNLESFLGEWGVDTRYHETTTGARYRYMVQDASQSLTADGYTVYGEAASEGRAAEFVGNLTRRAVFQNATALRAANGYTANGDGSYTKGNRTYYSLYQTTKTAVSWANGVAVDNSPASLFTVTQQVNADQGLSYVGVCGSVDFASEDFLQSAVHGNTDMLMGLFESFGKELTPKGLTIKPFASTEISTVTTAEKWRWTLVLCLVPAVIAAVACVAVMAKRRRA